MKLGVIGNGFVGKATRLLKNKDIEIIAYDTNHLLCDPYGVTLEDITHCDVIFISVPTPMKANGQCHTQIVENVVESLQKYINLDEKIVILRSTVPVGTATSLNCFFMPEFLTEKNFKLDFINNTNWIFGLKPNNKEQNEIFKNKMMYIISTAYMHQNITNKKVTFMCNEEAEALKLFRNTFLAVKISFCNEFEEFCKNKNINYETVRKYATQDDRIKESHTFVPGHDGKRGYGGTCFPKDIKSLSFQMKQLNMKSFIIDSSIQRNWEIDRKENDWIENKGRSII